MARRTSKQVGRTKKPRKMAPTQAVLPSIMARTLAARTELGRFVLRAALGVLATGQPVRRRVGPAGPSVIGDSRLPRPSRTQSSRPGVPGPSWTSAARRRRCNATQTWFLTRTRRVALGGWLRLSRTGGRGLTLPVDGRVLVGGPLGGARWRG
jgi:hypothetical protein